MNVDVQHQEGWVLNRARLQLVDTIPVLLRREIKDLVSLPDVQVVDFDFQALDVVLAPS